MAKIVFDDYEQECVHFLAERFNQGGDRVSVREFPRCNEVGEEKVQRVIARFCNYGWLEWATNVSLDILPGVLDIAHEIEHPPAKDYWQDTVTWFRSRWWSVPLLVVFLIVPLLVEWVQMVLFLLKWSGVLGKPS